MRATWTAFEDGTRPAFVQDGYVYGNCVNCNSTIGIPECALCGVGCDANDRLPFRNGLTVHCRCAVERSIEERGPVKFVLLAGGKKASEMRNQQEVARG